MYNNSNRLFGIQPQIAIALIGTITEWGNLDCDVWVRQVIGITSRNLNKRILVDCAGSKQETGNIDQRSHLLGYRPVGLEEFNMYKIVRKR